MSKQFSVKDKVCMITGAGKGIGREIANLFYNEGASLALITRNMIDLQSLKSELKLDDDRVYLFEGDVSDERAVKKFIAESVERLERIDVLINNAGMRFRKAFLDITTDE